MQTVSKYNMHTTIDGSEVQVSSEIAEETN